MKVREASDENETEGEFFTDIVSALSGAVQVTEQLVKND